MADKTFRQTVEEIIQIASKIDGVWCEEETTTPLCAENTIDACVKCLTNQVCEAVLKMAEGMQPMVLEAEVDYLAGYTDCWNDCQAYWRKQVE